MTNENKLSRPEIEAAAIHYFDFLDMEGKYLRDEPSQSMTRFLYLLPELSVEVELDWNEQAAFLRIGSNEEILPSYTRASNGSLVNRNHIGALLIKGGHRDEAEKLKQLTQRSDLNAMVQQLNGYASALKAHMGEFPALVRKMQNASSVVNEIHLNSASESSSQITKAEIKLWPKYVRILFFMFAVPLVCIGGVIALYERGILPLVGPFVAIFLAIPILFLRALWLRRKNKQHIS